MSLGFCSLKGEKRWRPLFFISEFFVAASVLPTLCSELRASFIALGLVVAGSRFGPFAPIRLCSAHLVSAELADWMYKNLGFWSIPCSHIFGQVHSL